MSKRARRIKNTAAVRLCAAALAALLLAPPAACGLGVVFGAGADAGDGAVLSAGVVFGDIVIRSDGCVFGDLVTCGADAARGAPALAGGHC
jgi:hypothetical protein